MKASHTDIVKLQNDKNEKLVQAMLGLTEQQYCDYKFDTGILYARKMTDNDSIGFEMLIHTKFFWQWWKNEWSKRDTRFLELYSADADKLLLRDNYRIQHNTHRLNDDDLMAQKAVSMIGFAMDEYKKSFAKEAAHER